MCKYIHLYIFILITSSINLNAQPINIKAKEIIEAYKNIQTIIDVNEKQYQLQQLSTQWLAIILQTEYKNASHDNTTLKSIVSNDGKYEIYYFPFIVNENAHIDYFVRDLVDEAPIAFYFSDVVIKKTKHPINIENIKLSFHESTIENNLKIHELRFLDSTNPIAYERISDVTLKCLFEAMALAQTNSEKDLINSTIINRLNKIWIQPIWFENRMHGIYRMFTLLSPDKKFKVITWNIEYSDGSHRFFGAAISHKPDKSLSVNLLTDKTGYIRSPERMSLTPKKWYGAIYYEIVQTEFKKQTYYTLLGYKGNDEFTKIKLIETVNLLYNGEPHFGSPILAKSVGYYNRLIFEFSATTNMMLQYDQELKQIVCDNLTPSNPAYKDNYRFYGPDFSYNSYRFIKGKWELTQDTDLRNPKAEK